MIVEVNPGYLMKLLKGRVSLEEVMEALDMFGTPVDEIKEDVLRIEVSPNRLDMLSTEGIARTLNGLFGFEKGLPVWGFTSHTVEVNVVGSLIRPFVSFSTVFDVKLEDEMIKSVMQMQEKLHVSAGRNRRRYSIGLYDLDKIKPPVKYLELPLEEISFVPLGEEEEMNGREILEKTEKGRAYGHLVGKKKAPVLMDSKGRIMSMAPVINAEWCKITEKTRNIFIDSTGTAPGTDTMVALIATSLAERGGKIGVILPGPSYLPIRMRMDMEEIRRIVGIPLQEAEIVEALEKMRYGVEGTDVLIPAYRADVIGMRDIAEDVAIGYGYEKIPFEIPPSPLFGEPLKESQVENEYRKLMLGFGFTEVKTFTLTSEELLKLAGEPKIRVQNPKTMEATTLRQSILPNLLELLEKNKKAEYPQRIFEIGFVFLPEQKTALAGAVAHKEASFAEIKGIVDTLLEIMGRKVEWKSGKHRFFMEGRTAISKIGVYGEVKPELAARVGMPIAAFEILI